MKKVRSKLHPTEIGVIKTFSLSPKDEIGEIAVECSGCTYYYNNLSELCEKWEDCEEPKKHYWVIDEDGVLVCRTVGDFANEGMCKQIGNYFETEEEAKKAVGRLRAWKRLKDKGFRFETYKPYGAGITFTIAHMNELAEDNQKELDLLFGGEE